MAIVTQKSEPRTGRAARAVAQPEATLQHVTPLLRFLRALDVDTRKQFAEECNTTVVYLYQLAAQTEPNPRLILAKAIVEATKKYGRRAMEKPLTYEDLLVGPYSQSH